MNRNSRLATLAISSVLASMVVLMTGCGGGGGDTTVAAPLPAATRPASVERTVLPATADPRVTTTALQAHVAINPSASVAPANKLFVFLPGTGGTPDLYRLVLRSGASRGFHTLGLNYPNNEAVGVTCLTQATNCFWDVRREVITGTNHSALVAVDDANSIVTRLTKAIAYLQAASPTEGWGQYLLASGAVDWSKVTVAGHSQGGGHAGVMAKLYDMNRAVYFASPPDWSGSVPAAWTSFENMTPASKQFGFTHLQDTSVSYSGLTAIWQTMGLSAFGAAVSVDTNATPFSFSHILTTQATPNNAGMTLSSTHGATIRDAVTPVSASGVPVFDAAWAYLCFPASP